MKKFLDKRLIGLLISIIFISVILHQVDINKTILSFGQMNPLIVLPIIPIYLFSFVIRAFRWRGFLAEKGLKFRSLISSIFMGFSLNCILPARAGELYRAYFFSKKENLSKTRVFTSVVLERFFDGFVLFLILLITIYFVQSNPVFLKIATLAGMIFLGGLAFLFTLVKMQGTGGKRERVKIFLNKIPKLDSKLIDRGFVSLNSFFDGLKTLNSISIFIKSFILSALIWGIEGIMVLYMIKSFGVEITYPGALLVLTVTAFSSLIPAGPAGIGPYQWGYIMALSVFGIEKELAFAISVTNQFMLILLILTIGLYFMWKDHINIDEKEIKLERELNWS